MVNGAVQETLALEESVVLVHGEAKLGELLDVLAGGVVLAAMHLVFGEELAALHELLLFGAELAPLLLLVVLGAAVVAALVAPPVLGADPAVLVLAANGCRVDRSGESQKTAR